MLLSKRPNRRLAVFPFLVLALIASLAFATPASAAGSPIRPDFCFAVNPGGADVEITFFPTKLNILQGDGADNAAFYRIDRSDGQSWNVQPDDRKNIHDTTAEGGNYSYQVYSVGDGGQLSRPTRCVAYYAESSISPGRLRDWRRSTAAVVHGLGQGPVDSSTRTFTGADHDVVTTEISAAENDTLNPAGTDFAFQAAITLSANNLAALAATPGPSWNVMQRGYASSAGGQWKMSLVMSGQPKAPRAQCAMRDGDGNTRSANSTYVLRADVSATITCVIDDTANTIRVIVNGRTDAPAQAPAGFGEVDPYHPGSTCWQRIARTIAIGNKPLCGNGTLTDDDRFQGRIRNARVLKG